jgi:hypothetical protein
MLDIISCCNDTRVADLKCLLRSIAIHAPDARLRIIPFDDDITETARLVEAAGGELMARCEIWTDLGMRLFHGRGHYRPGVPMWMYFHKLNMFNNINGPTLFLDANSVLLSGETPPLPAPDEVFFHSSAMKGRNIPDNAKFVRQWSPEIGEGYNLGYCLYGTEVARRLRLFAELLPSLHGNFLGPAPEQSFLMYALAFLGLKARLLHDVDAGIAPTNNSDLPIECDDGGIYRYTHPPFEGLRLLSAKRPGMHKLTFRQRAIFERFT